MLLQLNREKALLSCAVMGPVSDLRCFVLTGVVLCAVLGGTRSSQILMPAYENTLTALVSWNVTHVTNAMLFDV